MEKAFHALGARAIDRGPSICMAGLEAGARLRPSTRPARHVPCLADRTATGRTSSSPPRAPPKRLPTFAGSSAADRAALTQSVDAMAADGLRVLGVARATHAGPNHGRLRQHEFRVRVSWACRPCRSAPRRASPMRSRECRSAGIKVVMITGDYPATARAIAAQAGLERGELMTGEQLEKLSDAELASRVRTATCFRADHAGAEASHRQRAQGERRDRGDDRRRRQRCAFAQGGAYRHRDGRTRNRRRARGVIDRPARRRFRLDRQGDPARPPHLRQSSQGDGLHLRRPRADRGAGAAAAAVRLADPVRARSTSPFWKWSSIRSARWCSRPRPKRTT